MKTNILPKILEWLKRGLIGFSLLVALLLVIGLIYQTASTQADQRNFPPPGNLIDVGGFKMHLSCIGEGSPTVILETLSGGTSSYWGWVQPEVAQTTRVCVYDRAGRGWSEPDPEPISLARTVRNLHTLLTNAHIDGPYILVGHSIGGIYVRQYAADYPGEVVGMILVDAAHPEQFDRFPEMVEENESYLQMSAVFPLLARVGLPRLYFASGGEFDFGDLTEPQKSELKALWSSPDYFASQRAEVLVGPAILADGRTLGGVGNLPLIVLTQDHAADSWETLQNELAHLSSNTLHRIVEGSTHVSLAFNQKHAHEVSLAILQVWDTAQSNETLVP